MRAFVPALLMAALLLGLGFGIRHHFAAPFGNSHDGRNAGVWAGGSRSLRQNGPVASRLGTRTIVDGRTTVYADHPPLVYVETAATEQLFGEHPWTTRLPAWAATLVAILLTYRLLRWREVSEVGAAVGVAVAFGGPMIVAYGTMLDTPMIGLPFGIAVLVAVARGRAGRPYPWWATAGLAFLACLTSWLGVLTCGLAVVAEFVASRRARREPGDASGILVELVCGTAAGIVALVGWLAWAYGSLRPLVDQFLTRTGASGDVGTGGRLSLLVRTQRFYLPRVFSPLQLVLLLPALVVCVRDPVIRVVGAIAVAGWALWLLGFSDGAIHHDYWSYWLVVPLALGVAVMVDAGLRVAAGRGWAPLAVVGVTLATLAALVLGTLPGKGAPATIDRGIEAGRLAVALGDSPQRTAWFLGGPDAPTSWIGYDARKPEVGLHSVADVDRAAAAAPTDLVLVFADELDPGTVTTSSGPCRAGVPASDAVGLVRLGALASILHAGGRSCLPNPG